jgi:hypothetical protein
MIIVRKLKVRGVQSADQLHTLTARVLYTFYFDVFVFQLAHRIWLSMNSVIPNVKSYFNNQH